MRYIRSRVWRLLLILVVVVGPILPITPTVSVSSGQSSATLRGTIVAPVRRQASSLSFDDPPLVRELTGFPAPAYVTEVDVAQRSGAVVLAVQSPFQSDGEFGADLVRLDVNSGQTTPLLSRATGAESLVTPNWSADGAWLLFEREDVSSPPVSWAGQGAVHYSSRVEAAGADGSDRWTVVENATRPTLSPDGADIAYLRASESGTSLWVRPILGSAATERQLVPPG